MDTTNQKTIKGWVDRAKKYTRKWASRWCQFDPVTRRFSYSEKEIKDSMDATTAAQMIKSSIVIAKVSRTAELQELGATSDELYSMLIEPAVDTSGGSSAGSGGGSSSSLESWSIRFKDAEMFDEWFKVMRNSLAVAGLAEPYNVGLEEIDPRHNLKFARIPNPFLFRFVLLEKGVSYLFQPMTLTRQKIPKVVPSVAGAAAAAPAPAVPAADAPLQTETVDGIFVVGDRALYFFALNATVLRCSALATVTELQCSPGLLPMIRIGVKEPETDYLLTCPAGSPDNGKAILASITEVVTGIVRGVVGAKLSVTAFPGGETPKVDDAVGASRLREKEDFKMQVISPTPKSRLKQALDSYEKQHGEKFTPAGSRAKKSATTTAAGSPKTPSGGRASSTGVPGSSPKEVGPTSADESLPLVRLLREIGLPQYAGALLKQHVDIDVLQCMDLTDLETFGVKDKAHCEAILAASLDNSLVARVSARDPLAMTFSGSVNAMAPPPSLAGTTASLSASVMAAAAAAAGNASPTKKPVIDLSDDDDEIEAMMAASQRGGGGPASPMSATTNRPVIILSDSDDDDLDLLPPVQKTAADGSGGAASPTSKPAPVIPDADDL